jgi:AcrR family transcriptional regulator
MKVQTPPRPYRQLARAESAEATARRIIEAFLARMLTQWFDEITLEGVAADAGVTVQTVVRRFGGKEGLLGSAVKIFAVQVNQRRASPPGDLEAATANLVADYEQTGDAVMRLLALEPRHPALKEVLNFGRAEHRRWVGEAFSVPLSGLGAGQRQRAIDLLVIATDIYTWKLARRDMGRSVEATAGLLNQLIRAVLAEFCGETSFTKKSINKK